MQRVGVVHHLVGIQHRSRRKIRAEKALAQAVTIHVHQQALQLLGQVVTIDYPIAVVPETALVGELRPSRLLTEPSERSIVAAAG